AFRVEVLRGKVGGHPGAALRDAAHPEFQSPGRDGDADRVTDRAPQERGADRRQMADAALGRTRLHGPHDGVDHGLLRRRVDEVDGVADRDHFRPAPARFIDHLDVAQEQIELLDAAFDEGLLVLRVFILGVLRAVAELRGPLDPQGDLAALRRPQVPQFRLELIAALLGQKGRWWLGRAVAPHKCSPCVVCVIVPEHGGAVKILLVWSPRRGGYVPRPFFTAYAAAWARLWMRSF